MIKKLITLICMVLLITLSANAVFADNDVTEEEQLLTGLGLWNDELTSYDGYITALSGFLFEEPEQIGNAEDIARHTGMLSLTDTYKGKGKITYGDAVKYAVITLGYDPIIKGNGGGSINDYISKASELSITDGVTGNVNSKASYNTLVKILYNMLEAEPMQKQLYATQEKYIGEAGTTLLGLNRDIYKIYGLVTATEYTSVYNDKGTQNENYIEIDENEFLVTDKSFDYLLGYNVEAYVQEDRDGEKHVLYMRERKSKNTTLEIEAKDIENVSNDFSVINYYNENDKQKRAKIDGAVRVIFNGVYYSDYTVKDLQPGIGNLKLIDNDSDGSYDVIFVTSYETIIVDAIDADDGIIGNKYSFDDCIKVLTMDIYSDNVSVYDGKGNETTLSKIKSGDVISVAKSKGSSDRLINIYISGNDCIQSDVQSIDNEDNILKIGGVEYEQSEDFVKFLADENKSIDLEKEYIFYFDYFGYIAYMKQAATSDYKVVRRLYTDDSEEEVYIEFMDMAGEWYTLPFAEKVSLDGAARTSAMSVYNKISLAEPEIMKIRTNSNEEVISIDTPETGVVDEERFTKVPAANYTYRYDTQSFNVSIFLGEGAKVISIPQDKSNKDGYTIRDATGYFRGDSSYTVAVYDLTEYDVSKLFVVNETKESIEKLMSRTMMLVTGKGEKYVDGEVLPYIEGYRGVFEEINFIASESGILDGVEVGDVINFSLNSTGRINYATKITVNNSITDYHNNVNTFLRGKIVGIDAEQKMFKMTHGDNIGTFRLAPTKTVMFYDSQSNTCETKTAASLTAGDEVLVRMNRGVVQEMICFE